MGQNPRLLKSGRHSLEFYRELWATILDGRVWRGEFINQTRDQLYWELASIAPLRDENGLITHFVKVAEDISNRKDVEAELTRYRGQLEELVNERTAQLSQANQNLKLLPLHPLVVFQFQDHKSK